MVNELEFEKPVLELRKKIAELREFTKDSDVDLSDEIDKLETRLEKLEKEVYENMRPWDRVQLARHSARPTTLDYIGELFTDFSSCMETGCMVMMRRSSVESPNIRACLLRSLAISAGEIRKKIFAAILACRTRKAIARRCV